MKKTIALGLFILAVSWSATSAQDVATPPPADPESIASARMLMEATHAEDNVKLSVDAMIPLVIEQLKRDKADIPEAVIQQFIEIFRQEMAASIPALLDEEAKVYARHYSNDELLSIAKFYESDIGKKMIRETPFILKETFPLGEAWGRATGQHAAEETLKKLRAQGVKI